MHAVEPELYLIARPQVDTVAMLEFLRAEGGEAWFIRVFGTDDPHAAKLNARIPAAEGLIEFAGRLCYKSWDPGLNANVTKVREDRGEYLTNILRTGHGSVLEHAYFSLALRNVSRVLTAELNRHRPGVAISEQSLRYVRLGDLGFWEPPDLPEEILEEGRELVAKFESFYSRAVYNMGLDEPGADFSHKKKITSKLRRWAPLGLATNEVWTGNVRSIRHVIEMRSDEAAEEEIRIFADALGSVMLNECPLLFGDYDRVHPNDDQSQPADWVTEYRKV